MKKLCYLFSVILLFGGLILGNPISSKAASPSAAEFYEKNVVTLLCGFNPGGGSDYGARILASYWTAATGGAMIVKNKTGGGGLLATNFMNSSKPDGLTIVFGNFGDGFLLPSLFKDKAVKFDITKLNWLVGTFHEPWTLLTSTKGPYKTLADLKSGKKLKFASTSPTDPGAIMEAFLMDSFNLDGRLITGYKGGSAMGLAAGKGEVDVIPNPLGVGINSMKKGFVNAPFVVFDKERSKLFPDTPTIFELMSFTPEQEQLYKMVNMATYVIRVAAAPPGTPDDRVQFMRDAFAKIVKMKGFNNQAKLNFPMGPTPLLGEELENFVAESIALEIEPVTKMTKKYLSIF